MSGPNPRYHYSARHAYRQDSVPETYEHDRFSAPLGRLRKWREAAALTEIVGMLPAGISILDCPCGTGRWWELLEKKASRLVAVDISPAMLQFAGARAQGMDTPVELLQGDAECLPLEDGAVDYSFSHALTKHLPVPVQYEVLRELARVSRYGLVCSFGVFSHLTYELWRRRRLSESYPVLPEELGWMAKEAGLEIRARRRCTTPIGVEHTVLFECVE